MPYIITTKNPIAGERPSFGALGVTSHCAVATLDDPADGVRHLRSAMEGLAWLCLVDSIRDLPEQGGTVGPLPDGTVIEVEAVAEEEREDWAERRATLEGES